MGINTFQLIHHAHSQFLQNWDHHLLPDWNPRTRVCSFMDHYSHLTCVPGGHPWQLHHPAGDEDRALTPHNHVLFPTHAGCLWPGPVPPISPHYTEDLCFQCHRNFPKCLFCSIIHYSWVHRCRVLSVPGCVFWPLLAIYDPLRCSSLLTKATVTKMGTVFLVNIILSVLLFPFTLKIDIF